MTDRSETLLHRARLLVCVGNGGVGKTTTSAALALRAASEGRRVLVLTIDPAKRLADAMGLERLDNDPSQVDLSAISGASGELYAMMLDPQKTFDDLIRRTAGDESKSILENRLYRIMADYLAGTQEYMSLERLYDLTEHGGWDLIVLDTPPSQNAMDFFDAPMKTARFFDERIMRWLVPEANRDANVFRRVFNPGAVALRLLSALGGDEFVQELADFFGALNIIRESLQQRGHRVQALLREPTTAYLVVASPDPRRVAEAIALDQRLKEMSKRVGLFVLNRSHHFFERGDLASLEAVVARAMQQGAELASDSDTLRALGRITTVYEKLVLIADRDREGIEELTKATDSGRIRVVPILGRDIHTLSELLELSEHVIPPA